MAHHYLTPKGLDLAAGAVIGFVWWIVYFIVSKSMGTHFQEHYSSMVTVFLVAWIVQLILVRRNLALMAGVVLGTVATPIALVLIGLWIMYRYPPKLF
jgi:uncharacterized membrane protein YGL010W